MFNKFTQKISLAAALTLVIGSSASADTVPDVHGTIQAAIDAASEGDVITISPGVYQENLIVESKSLTFIATGGPSATILDGGEVGSVLRAVDASGSTLSLTGFTFRNGTGTDIGDGSPSGGGIVIDGNDLALSNCHVEGNAARYGGGVYLQYGSLYMESCVFSDNTAIRQGGAVAIHHADMYVAQSQFSLNSCSENIGGAIACALHNVGSLHVTDSTFDGNWAREAGGAIETHGDGAFFTVLNSTFIENIASNGGAIASHETPFSCSGSTFDSNQASVETSAQSGDGGAMWLQDSAIVDLADSSFLSNEAVSGGALMLHSVGQTTVQACTFADNVAFHADPNSGGGASHNIGCSPLYKNCTFSNNATPDNGNIGSALYVWNGTVAMEGCNLCGHAGQAIGTFDNGNWWVDDATSFEDNCCRSDLTGDGIVDAADLLIVIGAWASEFAMADVDGSGTVDVNDILLVISNWGGCP